MECEDPSLFQEWAAAWGDLADVEIATPLADGEELLAVHEALDRLTEHDPRMAELVKLRYFAGLSFDDTAEVLGVSPRTIDRQWQTAKAWLYREISEAA